MRAEQLKENLLAVNQPVPGTGMLIIICAVEWNLLRAGNASN